MKDSDVESLLRSTASLVVIEAPAGCGKTYQAASYTDEVARQLSFGQVLVLTHTHAACSVVAARTTSNKKKVKIQTIDSLINEIATVYRRTLQLDDDVGQWARKNGYENLAKKVAALLSANRFICECLARHYPVIVCDEHQDANEYQDAIVNLIHQSGSLLRVFGDPMQIIPGGTGQAKVAASALARWDNLVRRSTFARLERPHRWLSSNSDLGYWVQEVRETLQKGLPLDLRSVDPNIATIQVAENLSRNGQKYILKPTDPSGIRGVVHQAGTSLLIAKNRACIEGINGYLQRRFPIWEGHTRNSLEGFLSRLSDTSSVSDSAQAFYAFLSEVLSGFTRSKYGDRFLAEVAAPSTKLSGSVPPELARMAALICDDPSHKGFGRAAAHLRKLIDTKAVGFTAIHIDYRSELSDLIRLSEFDDPVMGYAEICNRRSRAHPKPAPKALSTIHKAKGLEASNVMLFACDSRNFNDTQVNRNLLYVALSRATTRLTIVLSRSEPSPLVRF